MITLVTLLPFIALKLWSLVGSDWDLGSFEG